MSTRRPDDAPSLPPPELAGYVDGELDAARCARVEAWLADHPEAAADVEAQRQLLRLWRTTPPPEPAESAWAPVLTRLEAVLPAAPSPRRAGVPWRALVVAGLVAASVAALVVGSWLLKRYPRPDQTPGSEPAEALEVASDTDVDIISMEGDDVSGLVTGEPLVSGPLVLALPDEVKVREIEPARVGDPPVRPPEGATAPMIWVGGGSAKEGNE
jgi:anti-sigma factor RsiW